MEFLPLVILKFPNDVIKCNIKLELGDGWTLIRVFSCYIYSYGFLLTSYGYVLKYLDFCVQIMNIVVFQARSHEN